MSRIKKISGPALHRSWLNIPHVTYNDEADITELDQWRKELDTKAKADGYRVTMLSFLIKASVVGAEGPLGGQQLDPSGWRQADPQELLEHRLRRRHPERPDGAGHQGRRRQGHRRDLEGDGRSLGQGAQGRAEGPGHAGGDLHHLVARRHRRHLVHADRQCARGGDPRRDPVEDGAGLERLRVRAAQHAAACRCHSTTGRSTGRSGRVSSPRSRPCCATRATCCSDPGED